MIFDGRAFLLIIIAVIGIFKAGKYYNTRLKQLARIESKLNPAAFKQLAEE